MSSGAVNQKAHIHCYVRVSHFSLFFPFFFLWVLQGDRVVRQLDLKAPLIQDHEHGFKYIHIIKLLSNDMTCVQSKTTGFGVIQYEMSTCS